jgi:hypothetical protein
MSQAAGRSPAGPRRRRADAGSVRFWERDAELLGFVAEQHAVTVPQLARLCAAGLPTVLNLRNRWRRAGWIESYSLTWRGPSFVWLTREGARVAQSPFRAIAPNPGLALHLQAVTDVRLLVERELGLGEWECERLLAKAPRRPGAAVPHLPDAVLETPRGRIAIEVELSLKSPGRLEPILAELARRYPEVWYFASARVAPTLRRTTAASPWRHIVVRDYPPRLEELCP